MTPWVRLCRPCSRLDTSGECRGRVCLCLICRLSSPLSLCLPLSLSLSIAQHSLFGRIRPGRSGPVDVTQGVLFARRGCRQSTKPLCRRPIQSHSSKSYRILLHLGTQCRGGRRGWRRRGVDSGFHYIMGRLSRRLSPRLLQYQQSLLENYRRGGGPNAILAQFGSVVSTGWSAHVTVLVTENHKCDEV